MFHSKSDFFKKNKVIIDNKREHLFWVMKDFGLELDNRDLLFKAFDYFSNNPEKFDGATIVKDIHTINGLDLPACRHDYDYIHNDWFSIKGFVMKFIYDWNYAKNYELFRVSSQTAYFRCILLWLSTPFWYLWLIIKILKKT